MCSVEFLRVLSVLAGMVCYCCSLVIVLWNVDRLDAVLQISEELHELNDFKVQIDTLNANDLADEDSDISMLQIVERNLAKQKRIVAEFYNNVWGDSLKDLRPFQELAADLEAGLQGDVKQPTASTTLSDMTVYKQIPSEAAVTPTETRLS
ncbi:unnamed protein product [Durusdinium trenchii]|uniref:Uncharacterized protein n=2 Tax=Durusdinium trenchii TaxID=1381693 RepID=A0ABP0KWY9_9DINO